jgi:hypothetical protein
MSVRAYPHACAHLTSGPLHGADDTRLLTTPTEDAPERLLDIVVAGVGVVLQKREGGHQESLGADATLEGALFPERALERMESIDSFTVRQ